MKRLSLLGAALSMVFVLALSSGAGATIVLDNLTLNLGGVDGLANGTIINDIQQIAFYGIAHAHLYDDGDGVAEVGEYARTDGRLAATSFIDPNGTILSPANTFGLNDAYEMTFDFSVNNVQTGPTSFTHIDVGVNTADTAADNLLDVWIDVGPDAASSDGATYINGMKIGTFRLVPGEGGVFDPSTLNGSDDASFQMIWGMAGVWLDEFGVDLSKDPLNYFLAFTDSDFDADGNNNGLLDQVVPSNWNFPHTTGGQLTDFYALEDGSVRFGTQPVPEPSTILLLGAGLLGVGFFGRKRMK